MPKRVKLPNGDIGEFPDNMSDELIEATLRNQFRAGDTKAEISRPPTGVAGVKSKFYTGMNRGADWIKSNLPMIGGTVGGLLGVEGGPVGVMAGAAIGGAAGRAAQQGEEFSRGKVQPSSGAAAMDIGAAGLERAAYEIGGLGMARIGKAIKPVSRGARLSYGAAGGMGGEVAMERLVPDFDKTLAQAGKSGAKTVGEFEDLVQATNTRLETEYGTAIQQAGAGGQEVSLQPVADAIRGKITPNMLKTPEGRATISYLKKRATMFEKPWSVREADLERSTVSKRLRSYHNASPSSAAAQGKIDAAVMADAATEDALKQVLYPTADRAAGKPAGYFHELKQKQAALIDLKDNVVAHREKLMQASAQKRGAPLAEKLHIYAYAHPSSGSLGSAGSTFSPSRFTDPLATANKAVQKGFPGTAGNAARSVRTATGTTLQTLRGLPIRVLFMETPPEPEDRTPAAQINNLKAIQNKHSNPMMPQGEQ
jgi:hypothetical protein